MKTNKLGAAKLSVGVNVALLISKIAVAYLTGSIGLLAESAHSLFDLVASILAYVGIKKAEEPSDKTHHYGHEKFENLSSLLQTALITLTAIIVIFEAYQKLTKPTPVEQSELGIVLMLITIPIAYFTSKYLNDTAQKHGGSSALEADSAHFLTDIAGSIAVLIGLVLVRFGYGFGDPLSALAVACVMLYISYELGFKSFKVFMDFSPDQPTMERIEGVLIEEVDSKRITRYHKLRARLSGSKIWVDAHIQLPRDTHVKKAHNIAHEIKQKIMRRVPEVKEVNIHIEPD